MDFLPSPATGMGMIRLFSPMEDDTGWQGGLGALRVDGGGNRDPIGPDDFKIGGLGHHRERLGLREIAAARVELDALPGSILEFCDEAGTDGIWIAPDSFKSVQRVGFELVQEISAIVKKSIDTRSR